MADPLTGAVRWRVGAMLLVLLASGVFLHRGVWRGLSGSHDLTMMYAGARQWVQGGNPYPLDAAYDAYVEGGGGAERPRDPKWFAQLYPPTTYAVMAPVGALSWSAGRTVFCGLNLAGWAVAGWWVWVRRPQSEKPTASSAAVRPHGKNANQTQAKAGRAWLAVAFLVWAPMHTTLAFGQLGGVVLGLVCLGVGCLHGRAALASGDCRLFALENGAVPAWRATAAQALRGLALALACCLKPQLAGLFVVVLAAAGRWRTVGWTCGWGALIAWVAVGRLAMTAPTWWADLRANVAGFAGTGFADPSRANPQAWQMINLEPWLRHVGAGELVAGWLPWGLGVGALVWAWAWGVRGSVGASPSRTTAGGRWDVRTDALLHPLAVAAAVSLLVVYHRSYDAVLLVFPAVWAWRRVVACGWLGLGGAAAALIALIGLPLPAVLSEAVKRGGLPGAMAETAWWVPGVLMHQNVALVLLLGVLCVGARGRNAQSAE